jgi:flagellar basal body-associated protein FliL
MEESGPNNSGMNQAPASEKIQKPSGSKKWIWIVGIILVILIVGGVIVWKVFLTKESGTESTPGAGTSSETGEVLNDSGTGSTNGGLTNESGSTEEPESTEETEEPETNGVINDSGIGEP